MDDKRKSTGYSGSEGADAAAPGHETRDVDVRGVGILVGAVLGTVIVAMALMIALFARLEGREAARQSPPASLAGAAASLAPEPRLQRDSVRDLDAMRFEEERELESWGWIDREAGIVRMPIEEAMNRVVARGLPSRPAAVHEEEKP